jgi:hypothetical protein
MSDMASWVAVVAIVVAIVVLWLPRLFSRLRRLFRVRDGLHEAGYPLFSAETSAGTEAEYVDDRRSRRLPRWTKTVASVVLIAAALYLLVGPWTLR